MPSAVSRGWRLRTVTLAPASRSRCATGRPSVPVPLVTRIDVVMLSPAGHELSVGTWRGYARVIRLVSLLPSATEIVYALGLGDQLVGVTFECDEPPSARADKTV